MLCLDLTPELILEGFRNEVLHIFKQDLKRRNAEYDNNQTQHLDYEIEKAFQESLKLLSESYTEKK